uniref:Uncharacterized protein n=1 Tax=Zooxanthella nutricula TaxID=1333877 RepID=A0A6U6X9K6_9DINO|mmetsp:Transcript_97391/g.297550  ORF Transcript_97391/g.297550 Transcript_97391/m.297550 type:complete len:127 (+) Transcript_97391:139-519(+)
MQQVSFDAFERADMTTLHRSNFAGVQKMSEVLANLDIDKSRRRCRGRARCAGLLLLAFAALSAALTLWPGVPEVMEALASIGVSLRATAAISGSLAAGAMLALGYSECCFKEYIRLPPDTRLPALA